MSILKDKFRFDILPEHEKRANDLWRNSSFFHRVVLTIQSSPGLTRESILWAALIGACECLGDILDKEGLREYEKLKATPPAVPQATISPEPDQDH